VANGLERITAAGNGQVPIVAALAYLLLSTPEYQGGRVGLPNPELTDPKGPV